ncbi:unnamed protein product [Coregonus sp. 'balchen']|nr:unnamed protein product [Coregonus sp. 'balchen']
MRLETGTRVRAGRMSRDYDLAAWKWLDGVFVEVLIMEQLAAVYNGACRAERAEPRRQKGCMGLQLIQTRCRPVRINFTDNKTLQSTPGRSKLCPKWSILFNFNEKLTYGVFYIHFLLTCVAEGRKEEVMLRTQGVKPGPVDAMVVVKPKPDATPASRIRSTLYKGYSGELPDPSTLNPLPAYADMEPDSLPLLCRMNITSDKPLVDSIFGKVQTGSILSYQHPPPPPGSVVIHEDAPPFPKVPLDGYHLQPTDCTYEIMTDQEKLHLSSLSVTLSQSHLIEEATRCQSDTPKWHSLRKERVAASHFREVSHVRGTSTAEKLAERIIRGTRQTPLMKRGLEMEAGALKDYAVLKNLNLTKCGLVVHPDAPWLGASPDGLQVPEI